MKFSFYGYVKCMTHKFFLELQMGGTECSGIWSEGKATCCVVYFVLVVSANSSTMSFVVLVLCLVWFIIAQVFHKTEEILHDKEHLLVLLFSFYKGLLFNAW